MRTIVHNSFNIEVMNMNEFQLIIKMLLLFDDLWNNALDA